MFVKDSSLCKLLRYKLCDRYEANLKARNGGLYLNMFELFTVNKANLLWQCEVVPEASSYLFVLLLSHLFTMPF